MINLEANTMDRVEYEKVIVQDLLNLHKNGELELNPWYQRRSVWTQQQKAYLINTLLEKKPIPSLYIRHSLDIDAERSIREVVDGQQRIRAILEFVDGLFPAKHPNHSPKVRYSQLKRSEMESFKLTSLSIGFLLGASDEDVIEIFGRLNSVAKSHNAQEKRNARFSGEFKQFCLVQAVSRLTLWRDLRVFSANDIARMEEVQFISDLTLNFIYGLSDYSTTKLDKIYEEFDEYFPKQEEINNRFEKVFSQIAVLHPETIRDTVFSRPPLFFSLCILLDSAKKKIAAKHLETTLFTIDRILNSDTPLSDRKEKEAEFILGCSASTQRIRQRTIRNDFIGEILGI
jgi:uncharacterized protein with ParB-like and HNH nuclease domain